MTHHTDAERAEFEAWARDQYPSIDLTRDGDDYSKSLAKDYWSLWQAARRAQAAPVPQGWIDPNNQTQKQYLPHIGERVLFKHVGRVYLGKHTGGSFKAEYPFGATWNF